MPSISRRRLLATAAVASAGGAAVPRLAVDDHDPTPGGTTAPGGDDWPHPLADPGRTAATAAAGPTAPAEATWRRTFDPSSLFRCAGIAVVDDRVLVPTHGAMRAFAAADGDSDWTTALPDEGGDRVGGPGGTHRQIDTAPRVASGRCFVASLSSVYALGTGAGRPRLRIDVASSVDGLTLLGNTLFVASRLGDGEFLTAFDTATGVERWRVPDRPVPVAADADRLLVARRGSPGEPDADRGRLDARDPADGALLWESDARVPAVAGEPTGIALAGDAVYTAREGALVALDAATGDERWREGLAGEPASFGDRIAVRDGVAVVQPDAERAAWYEPSGERRWARPLDGAEHGVSVGANAVYVATRSGLAALDPSTGETRWRLDVAGTPGHGYPPAVVDGAVYGVAGDTVYGVVES